MRFVNDISQIGERRNGETCYCEYLMNASDLQLQANLPRASNVYYDVKIYTYSGDGTMQIEDATANYSWWVSDTPGGRKITLRLNSFTNSMCAMGCFTVRLTVTAIPNTPGNYLLVPSFDRYTDVYCMSTCCDVARDIVISQEDMLPPTPGDVVFSAIPFPAVNTGYYFVDRCGNTLIRFRGKYECLDADGYYYGVPSSVISSVGTPFAYDPVHVLSGQITRLPRDIQTQISFNCKTQRTESFRPYRVQSFEMLPPWKMDEVETALSGYQIIVNDLSDVRTLKYDGGEAFGKLVNCWERFKLDVTLRECTSRVDFGCGEPCGSSGTTAVYYAIPTSYNDGGYYDDNRQPVAVDDSNLIAYFEAQSGVVSVTDVTSDYSGYHIVLEVETTNTVLLPAFIYYDNPVAAYQVYMNQQQPSVIVITCPAPQIGTVTSENIVCAKPVIGEVVSENIITVPITAVFQNDWQQWPADPFEAEMSDSWVRIKVLNAFNTGYIYDPPAFPSNFFANEYFANIDPRAWPSQDRTVSLGNGRSVTIDTNGRMFYSGSPASETILESSIWVGVYGEPEIIYEL